MMTTLIGCMKLYLKAFLMLCLSLVKNILSLQFSSPLLILTEVISDVIPTLTKMPHFQYSLSIITDMKYGVKRF